ncbi:MAG TPA: DsbA family protein, partial [Anaerolineales bacterium]|nr:DsbA family protein [Anaerolineales bacterium]
IQLTEFSDFQCPYSKRHYTQTEPLLEQYYVNTNLVHATYRSAGNFISQGGGTESQDAAMAAYCAGDQNKFWQMHDALFA